MEYTPQSPVVFDDPLAPKEESPPKPSRKIVSMIVGGVVVLFLIAASGIVGAKVVSEKYLSTSVKPTPTKVQEKVIEVIIKERSQGGIAKLRTEKPVPTKPNTPISPTGSAQKVNTAQIDAIRNYCGLLGGYKSSTEGAKGSGISEEDLNRLIDLYSRQIVFCDTLIPRISGKTTLSPEDDAMWKAISDLSYESSALYRKLSGT